MQSVYNHKFRRSMNNSSTISPVLPKGCVANCVGRVWFGVWLWYGRGVQIWGFGKQASVATIQSTPKVSQLVCWVYGTSPCTTAIRSALLYRSATSYAADAVHVRFEGSNVSPWQDVFNLPLSKLQRTFAAILRCISHACWLLRAWQKPGGLLRSMRLSLILLLGPVLGPVLAPVLGAVLGPVLGTTIRIERTGAKTEAKTGSQIWTQKWNHFRKIVRAFFRACGESLSAMELPMFCNFRLFSCSRASLHAFCDSQLKRSSQLLEKERAQAWVSPICAPSNNCCSRHPNCTRSNKPYNVQEFDAAV